MHFQRIILIVCAGIAAYLVFQPWASLPFVGEVNGMSNATGIVILSCCVMIALLSFIGTLSNSLQMVTQIIGAVIGVVISGTSGYFIYTIYSAKQSISTTGNVLSALSSKLGGITNMVNDLYQILPFVYVVCGLGVTIAFVCVIFSANKGHSKQEFVRLYDSRQSY